VPARPHRQDAGGAGLNVAAPSTGCLKFRLVCYDIAGVIHQMYKLGANPEFVVRPRPTASDNAWGADMASEVKRMRPWVKDALVFAAGTLFGFIVMWCFTPRPVVFVDRWDESLQPTQQLTLVGEAVEYLLTAPAVTTPVFFAIPLIHGFVWWLLLRMVRLMRTKSSDLPSLHNE
jgi:hypothetical protein